MDHTSYPAKLLLFGEYTIIQGAKALAVPFTLFGGQWSMAQGANAENQKGLYRLWTYLDKNYKPLYDVARFTAELENGLFFKSDIPQGYGAGSSGALTAAVYDRFAYTKTEPQNARDLEQLQKQLAAIESCFHGASSGADPLVCYLQQGVLFQEKKPQLISKEQTSLEGFFLIDTQISRKTAPLVNLYKSWCEQDIYPLRIEAELVPLVEEAIDAFLQKNPSELFEGIHQIGYFQFKYFADMIPGDFRAVWLDALASRHTKLKLCGAGGGGFILGYSNDMDKTKLLLADYPLIMLANP